MSRRTTMRCMRFVCSTSKSRTVRPRAVGDAEAQLAARGRRCGGSSVRPRSLTARPRTGCGAARLHAVDRLARRGARPPRGRRRRTAGDGGAAEDEAEDGGEAGDRVAALMPSPARAGWPWPVYSDGRSSIAPSIASSIATCSATQRADVLDDAGRQQRDRPERGQDHRERHLAVRPPAVAAEAHPADHRDDHRRRHGPEHRRRRVGPAARPSSCRWPSAPSPRASRARPCRRTSR